MKYLTTLEVAHEVKVSKQTLLNWLYAGKIPEPPRNGKGYRLWSAARVILVKRLIREGRLHKRTVVHREPSNRPEVMEEFAREVNQFLRDGDVDAASFLRELARLNPAVSGVLSTKVPPRGPRPPRDPRLPSRGTTAPRRRSRLT
jgi:hypothetical protein